MKPQTVVEQLLFSTVRIEADKSGGTEAGTSFIFSYEHYSKQYLFLVTNKHVVEGARVGRFFFTLSDEQVSELDALEEILFVGYPSGIYDAKNLMPILRRGTTATPPQLDYGGAKVFLVDASVFPGSSGSPVLICNQGSYGTRQGIVIGTRVLFLGVIAQVVIQEEEGTIQIVAAPSSLTPVVRTRQMIDLGIVYKAVTVVETVQEVLRRQGILT